MIIAMDGSGRLKAQVIVLRDYDTALVFLKSVAMARRMKLVEGCTLLQIGALFGSEISIVKSNVNTLTPLARLKANSEKK